MSHIQAMQYTIPVRVLLTALEEYGASLHQWQLQAEAGHREKLGLRDTIAQLQREKQECIQREEMQQRVVQAQQELIETLERDLADLAAAQRAVVPTTEADAVTSVAANELGVYVPLVSSMATSPSPQSDDTSHSKTLMSFAEAAESVAMGALKRKADQGYEIPSKRAEIGTWD